MTESDEKSKVFLGTYFDRDHVIRISRLAGIFAWIVLAVYILTTLVSFTQFMIQFASGVYYQKGLSPFDLVGFFTPYLLQPLPGFVYFLGLKFAQNGMLILLDVEDNTRRAARK